jgi:hypothetical protein
MPKNQLFKINPDINIIQEILDSFGLENLEDNRLFTKDHMKEIRTSSKIIELNEKLKKYYLPCKSKKYLLKEEDLNKEKKSITILRQFIKTMNYNCVGIEKSINGKKTMTYRLLYCKESYLSSPETKKNEYILSFDI